MKIIHTISGLSPLSGGPSTCTHDLIEGLNDIGTVVNLLTVECSNPTDYNMGKGSPWLKETPNDYKTPLGFSKNFRDALVSSDYDIYHCNALWSYISHITCKVARDKHKPYVLSPHGMLYPTALKIRFWKKWPMLQLWYNKDIHSASCLHATCMQEKEHCRAFGYKGPIAVIPNPVVFPEGVELSTSKPAEKKIGFLGRLHPIKKVENLLLGAAIAIQQGYGPFTIEIMGEGLNDYEQFLHNEVEKLNLQKVVNFVGFVSGKDKYDRLAELRALMVPSEQENFGMIVPEALICGTPVYASLGTPWKELNDCNCGWWEDNSPETISTIIKEVTSKSESQILKMGINGRKLMEEKYEQHKVAGMMNDLYKWIQNKNDKPDFVYLK